MSIFLSGSSHGESLLGTFIIRDGTLPDLSGININDDHLDRCTPVLDWYPPPPDNEWYPVKDGNFGPCLTELQVGYLFDSEESARLKPCDHSTINGTIFASDQSEVEDSKFTHRLPNATGWYTATADHYFGQEFGTPGGTPCKRLVDMTAYGRDDRLVYAKYPLPLALDHNFGDYWLAAQRVTSQRLGKYARKSLAGEGLVPYDQDVVAVRANLGVVTPQRRAWDNTYVCKARWTFRSREEWRRELWLEYHTTASYTPQSSVGFLEIPYCRHGLYLVTDIRLKFIGSGMPGQCRIKYDVTHSYQTKGWVPWSDYYQVGRVPKSEQLSAVLMLEPGTKRTWASPELARAQQFCELAPHRIRESIDLSKSFSESRLAALNDVTALESNWLENASGLPGTFDVVNPLVDGANAVSQGNFRMARNALASAYIAYRFAVAPNISDVHDVKDNLGGLLASIKAPSPKPERRRGKATVSNPFLDGMLETETFTEYLMLTKNDCFSKLWDALSKLGLNPSAGHAWDLIPFSFVADWFANLGDILTDVSAYNSAALTKEVLGSVNTAKSQYTLSEYYFDYLFNKDGENLFRNVGAPLTYVWYDRHVGNTIGEVNPFSLEVSSPSRSQMVLGGALITTIFL